MISQNKFILTILIIALAFSSCRSEEDTQSDLISGADTMKAEDSATNLIINMTMLDGSFDNVIDNANCFTIKLPFSIILNGESRDIKSKDDYEIIEDDIDEFIGVSTILIDFPVTIQYGDYSTDEVANLSELNLLALECNGENVPDIDIECLDFEYPIDVTQYNSLTDKLKKFKVNNDAEMYQLVADLGPNDIANLNFPITLDAFDEASIIVTSLLEFENLVEARKDDCDEDDDFDFTDDICIGCTPSKILDILTQCSDWTVEYLTRANIDDLEELYEDFTFNFSIDGTMNVNDGILDYPGTWSQSENGSDVEFMIDIPLLPHFNFNWILYDIHEHHDDRKDADFRNGSSDRLKLRSPCGL